MCLQFISKSFYLSAIVEKLLSGREGAFGVAADSFYLLVRIELSSLHTLFAYLTYLLSCPFASLTLWWLLLGYYSTTKDPVHYLSYNDFRLDPYRVALKANDVLRSSDTLSFFFFFSSENYGSPTTRFGRGAPFTPFSRFLFSTCFFI